MVLTEAGNSVVVYLWDTDSGMPDYFSPPPGREFSRIQAKVCVGRDFSEPITVADFAWNFSLQMPDDTRITPAYHSAGGGDQLAGNQSTLAPGDCAKGTVLFESPKHDGPKYVVFSSSSVIKWRV